MGFRIIGGPHLKQRINQGRARFGEVTFPARAGKGMTGDEAYLKQTDRGRRAGASGT